MPRLAPICIWFAVSFGSALGNPLLAQVGKEARAAFQEKVDRALKRAEAPLGTWLRDLRGGPHALVCLAALHNGFVPTAPAMREALTRMRQASLGTTYELGIRLMVEAELPEGLRNPDTVRHDTKRLLQHITKSGGFDYTPGGPRWDMSCTQYGALGLRAAHALGMQIEAEVWLALANRVSVSQCEDGSWGYSGSPQGKGNGSMTAAGIAVLEICAQMLGERFSPDWMWQIDQGWEWFRKNAERIGSPREDWVYYYHYGLERAAILGGKERIGEVDWYVVGGSMLLKAQHKNGWWPSQQEMTRGFRGRRSPDPVSSAFAVLFLRKAFRRELDKPTGPTSKAAEDPLEALENGAPADAVEKAVALLVLRGRAGAAEAVRGLGSGTPVRRRAALQALVRIAGGDFGYHPYRSPPHNKAAIQRAKDWLKAWQALPPGKPAPAIPK